MVRVRRSSATGPPRALTSFRAQRPERDVSRENGEDLAAAIPRDKGKPMAHRGPLHAVAWQQVVALVAPRASRLMPTLQQPSRYWKKGGDGWFTGGWAPYVCAAK